MSPFHDDPDDLHGLDGRDRAILDFEREWWRYAGHKEQAIREHFDMSTTAYYRAVNELIDQDAAMAYDPMLVKRMRRMRARRNQQRAAARVDAGAH